MILKENISAAKTSQSKVRRGRGPAVHEALQRIPVQRALPVLNRSWHAPGQSLFDCGPLDDRKPTFRLFESSSDDENVLEFGKLLSWDIHSFKLKG